MSQEARDDENKKQYGEIRKRELQPPNINKDSGENDQEFGCY
jgi:hypothetical protein